MEAWLKHKTFERHRRLVGVNAILRQCESFEFFCVIVAMKILFIINIMETPKFRMPLGDFAILSL